MNLAGGVDDVITLITNLRDSIDNEQSEADTAHGTFQD